MHVKGLSPAYPAPQVRAACAWWVARGRARAAWKYCTPACGALCATTTGGYRTPPWSAASWAAGRPWPPPPTPSSATARGTSSWTTCTAKAARPAWQPVPASAGECTTAAITRTRECSAQVLSPGTRRGGPPGAWSEEGGAGSAGRGLDVGVAMVLGRGHGWGVVLRGQGLGGRGPVLILREP